MAERTGWSLEMSHISISSGGDEVIEIVDSKDGISGCSPILPDLKRFRTEGNEAMCVVMNDSPQRIGEEEEQAEMDGLESARDGDITGLVSLLQDEAEAEPGTDNEEMERAQQEYNIALEEEAAALAVLAVRRVALTRNKLRIATSKASKSSRSHRSRSRFQTKEAEVASASDVNQSADAVSIGTASITGLRGMRDDLSSMMADAELRNEVEHDVQAREALNAEAIRTHQDEIRRRENADADQRLLDRTREVEQTRRALEEQQAAMRQRQAEAEAAEETRRKALVVEVQARERVIAQQAFAYGAAESAEMTLQRVRAEAATLVQRQVEAQVVCVNAAAEKAVSDAKMAFEAVTQRLKQEAEAKDAERLA